MLALPPHPRRIIGAIASGKLCPRRNRRLRISCRSCSRALAPRRIFGLCRLSVGSPRLPEKSTQPVPHRRDMSSSAFDVHLRPDGSPSEGVLHGQPKARSPYTAELAAHLHRSPAADGEAVKDGPVDGISGPAKLAPRGNSPCERQRFARAAPPACSGNGRSVRAISRASTSFPQTNL
jgi:hypothetical protein